MASSTTRRLPRALVARGAERRGDGVGVDGDVGEVRPPAEARGRVAADEALARVEVRLDVAAAPHASASSKTPTNSASDVLPDALARPKTLFAS